MPTDRSHPPSAAAGADTRRITPGALLQRALATEGGEANRALLVVALNRSDRLAALAQQQSARYVLGEVARRVETILRRNDCYAVAAIDELWLLLSSVPSRAVAELAGRTLHKSLARPCVGPVDGKMQTLGSLRPAIGGIWYASTDVPGPMELLAAAAENCRQAVATEEQVQVTPPDQMQQAHDHAQLATELGAALHANELDVYFQPQVDLASGRCVGAEALVRWARPGGSPVSPALISRVAEERGLVGHLTQFVLNTALRNLMAWSAQGIDLGVSINLSSLTLADASYPIYVNQALATWGVAPERLTLELTESLIVKNERAAQEFFDLVRAAGCRIALDDFGTGYSSFDYLRKFPMDELKIDQSFVRGIGSDRNGLRIVKSLIEVAHTFELKAVAEGIESAQIAQSLSTAGCDLGQGYLYARPLPAPEFERWYRSFNRCGTETALCAP